MKKGWAVLAGAVVIVIIELLQMAALHDISKGTEEDYSAEWMMVQIGFIFTGIIAVLLILISMVIIKKSRQGIE
jgi:hypothetical protein